MTNGAADYLELWSRRVLERRRYRPRAECTVIGVRDRLLGPRRELARVEVRIEPADAFRVVDRSGAGGLGDPADYLEWTVFGMLDVLMTAEPGPVCGVVLCIERLDVHPIHASQMAFLRAGRDAARKFLEAAESSGGFEPV